jgi:hypothetical protein
MTKAQTFHGAGRRARPGRKWRALSSAPPGFAVKLGRAAGAFTLVELLPVISRIKLKAMQVPCLNNLRQIALANTMYLSDYHETCLEYDVTGAKQLWMGRLIEYQAKVDSVRLCPAANDTNATPLFGTANKAWHYDSKEPARRWNGSYCLNGWLYSNLTNRNGRMPNVDQDKIFQKESNILMPSQTPVFADGITVDCWPRTNNLPPRNLYMGIRGAGFNGGLGRVIIDRHGGIPAGSAPTNVDTTQPLPGAINVACVDGHVELSKLENLWNFYWNQTWVPPNPRPR